MFTPGTENNGKYAIEKQQNYDTVPITGITPGVMDRPGAKNVVKDAGTAIKKAVTGNGVQQEGDQWWIVAVVVIVIAGGAFAYWYFTKKMR